MLELRVFVCYFQRGKIRKYVTQLWVMNNIVPPWLNL